MTLEFILKNIHRYKAVEKYLLKCALHSLLLSCLFWVYIGIVFIVFSLFNLSVIQLTVSIIAFSVFTFIFSILYLRKTL